MRHHTKDKGDLGVFKAQADLAEKGFTILIPLTEHSDFDLVAYKNQRFLRIQVKYRAVQANGVISIPMKSSWADRHGSHENKLDKKNVDLFCVYCPDTDECYYFNPKQFRGVVYLRVNPPANNQKKNIHFAKDFLRVP